MTLKTFNVDEDVYKEFSSHCKKEGISMSKRVENFMKKELEFLTKDLSNLKENKFNEVISKKNEKDHSMGRYC